MSLLAPGAEAAAELLARHLPAGRWVALTGAGLSTDSGIPDYRGPASVARAPMTYAEFLSGPTAQRRYWARSFAGWSRMSTAEPNPGHRALAALDPALLITQNVDGLHERAGSRRLIALHGRISEVICLSCRRTVGRDAFQARLAELNPGFLDRFADVTALPDGDADPDADPNKITGGLADFGDFRLPDCTFCGGAMKPDVVFFGENVPADRVARCYAAIEDLADDQADDQAYARADDRAGPLLVAGSSLTVMSGLRFVRRAAAIGIPIVIVNRGPTRADDLATHRLEMGCSEFLTALASRARPLG
ncbi:MAG: Sir2 family NAD-dependent protein deacetylase [Nocardioides sp.]